MSNTPRTLSLDAALARLFLLDSARTELAHAQRLVLMLWNLLPAQEREQAIERLRAEGHADEGMTRHAARAAVIEQLDAAMQAMAKKPQPQPMPQERASEPQARALVAG